MSFETYDLKWGASIYGTPSGTITWWADIDGIDFDDALYDQIHFDTALEDAFDRWEEVADVDFEIVSSQSLADVTVELAPLDGSTVGLASISYYDTQPVGRIAEGTVTFDSTETWAPEGQTDLNFYAVALHEIGHILGLDHVNDLSQIMNPVISRGELGEGDIAGMQFIYGAGDAEEVVPEPAAPADTPEAPDAPHAEPDLISERLPEEDTEEGGLFESLFGWIFDLLGSLFGGGDDEGDAVRAAEVPPDEEDVGIEDLIPVFDPAEYELLVYQHDHDHDHDHHHDAHDHDHGFEDDLLII